jgi:hypothetical protein
MINVERRLVANQRNVEEDALIAARELTVMLKYIIK